MKEIINRKAHFEYQIEKDFDAGMVLTGPEIKAIRQGKINISGSYIKNLGDELFLVGSNISAKESDPIRSRKLLLHRDEINKLLLNMQQKGYTILPLKGYFKRGKFKLLIGVGKGKKLHDKRASIRERDLQREADKAIRQKMN